MANAVIRVALAETLVPNCAASRGSIGSMMRSARPPLALASARRKMVSRMLRRSPGESRQMLDYGEQRAGQLDLGQCARAYLHCLACSCAVGGWESSD